MAKLLRIGLLLFISIAVISGAVAADVNPDDMLKKASNINVTVPQPGNAVLGTKDSMTQMTGWLNACVEALLSLFRDIMNLFGLGNMDYTKDMTKTLQQGANLSNVPPKK